MPIEPLALHADATDLELEMQSYERPYIDAIAKALLAKYVMKKSGSLPHAKSDKETHCVSDAIDFLRARITRDDDGTMWCDQSKYILHCMRENKFINEDGQVVLKRGNAPPAVDEKVGEEEGTVR